MKKLVFIFLLAVFHAQAQELFVFTEPASNMPMGSLGVRITGNVMKQKQEDGYNYRLLPELMWGVNKNLMIHAEGFTNNNDGGLAPEGFGVYGKYRFLSNEKVHSHFRMAAFGKISYNSSSIQQEEIDINGNNSGYQAGLIATQLLYKVAVSSAVSYVKATDNHHNKFPASQSDHVINYTFSFGKLMLPKEYKDYKQTSLNFMFELLGQTLGGNGRSYFDAAPSIQLIFNSQARLDIGYRQQLYSSMLRSSPNGFLLRFEYLFFNVLK